MLMITLKQPSSYHASLAWFYKAEAGHIQKHLKQMVKSGDFVGRK